MRKLCAALLCWLALASAALAQNTPACNRIAVFGLTTGTTQLVAGAAGKQINICGWDINPAAGTPPVFFQLFAGTGPTCTSPANMSPTFNFTAGSLGFIFTNHTPTAFVAANAGQTVCALVSPADGSVLLTLYYTITP